MYHHARLIFVFLVEIGFHYVGQAGLELLTSGDPPSSVSQSAEIKGMRQGTQPVVDFEANTILSQLPSSFLPMSFENLKKKI